MEHHYSRQTSASSSTRRTSLPDEITVELKASLYGNSPSAERRHLLSPDYDYFHKGCSGMSPSLTEEMSNAIGIGIATPRRSNSRADVTSSLEDSNSKRPIVTAPNGHDASSKSTTMSERKTGQMLNGPVENPTKTKLFVTGEFSDEEPDDDLSDSTSSVDQFSPDFTVKLIPKLNQQPMSEYQRRLVMYRRLKYYGIKRHSSLPQLWPHAIGGTNNIEDAIFSLFVNDDGKVNVGRFLKEILSTGVRKTDQRLANLVQSLEHQTQLENGRKLSLGDSDGDNLCLSREQFSECISGNVVLINRLLRKRVIIPEWQEFRSHIEDIYNKCMEDRSGSVATYIPQLARVPADYWAVSVCTVDGQRCSFGDYKKVTCLQSVSKIFNYSMAHRDLGCQKLHQFVGMEPSGRYFNELALDYDKKPHNPLINAGAILSGSKLADRFDAVMDFYRKMAGGEHIGFNNAVFLSERDTADRNYALAYYMRENSCYANNDSINLQETLDFYFQLCSVDVAVETAAVMAATYANGGICPITDENVISTSTVRDSLSLMSCCGMYDYSGKFAFEIGLPAKSGVSGLIVVVVPNVMAIALWSPRLDRYGNSLRGVKFCRELVNRFNFHNYDSLKRTSKKLDPRRPRTETRGQMVVNLLFSATNGDITALRRYYLQGFDLSIADYDGRTALHLAAAEGHIDCVSFLLNKCGSSPFVKDRWGHMPIDDANMNKHSDIINLLQDSMLQNKRTKSTVKLSTPRNPGDSERQKQSSESAAMHTATTKVENLDF